MGKRFQSIIAIGDLHLPFHHRPTFTRILQLIELLKPPYVVFMGDIYDLYSFNKFAQRISMGPVAEIAEGREIWEEMIRLIRRVSPKSKIFCIKGNHDMRAHKRHWDRMGAHWEAISIARDIWSMPGLEVVHDPRDVLTIQGINFTHGHLSKLGAHCEAMDWTPTVRGHDHTGGVWFRRLGTNKTTWELDAGYVGDPFHEALLYRALKKYFKWTHGVGLIDYYGPRFIHF